MKYLFCDFESRSDVDIGSCGAFKYFESPEFRPLLLAYGFDQEPLKLVDFMSGDTWPEDFLAALDDPDVTLVAHNNAFERGVIAHELHYSPDERWIDTMHLFAQCGLPLSLDGACKAMGLSEDQGKMKEGKALIRYFCIPCKPTKTNGGRTWNLPEHAPDKWETFGRYCLQDVEAMRTGFYRCLQWLPRPEEMRFHALDARINERGVRIDRQLAQMAVAMDLKYKDELTEKAVALTGMENPNSVAQVKAWLLEQEGQEIPSLNKKVIADVVAGLKTEDAKKFMAIRTELAKSSVKKFAAMLRAMCADDHVKGCFQFYGANRTGRAAGRIVQFQNLSKNYMADLDDARELVRGGHYTAVKVLYDSVSDVLSQLVRTAIIPEEGHRILVADFSAIEARVLAWLAGEQWVLDAFRNGEDIYCKTASAMFRVPVVKHGENGHLRSKGKVAVLACIAEDQLVLTDRGLVPIQDVLRSDLVWDGAAWVQHEGVIYKGEREVITYDGLTATPDHLVYIEGAPGPIRFADAASCGAHLQRPQTPWSCHRKCGGRFLGETLVEKLESLLRPDPVRHVRACAVDRLGQPAARCKPWLSKLLPTAARVSEMAVQTNVGPEGAMFKPKAPKLGQLRRAWDHLRLSLRQSCLRMGRPGTGASEERPTDGTRPDRQRQGLRTGQSALGHAEGKLCESTLHEDRRVASGGLAVYPQCSGSEAQGREDQGSNPGRRLAGRAGEKKKLARHKKVVRVYDIRNAGPQHRFTVSGVLVHNCGYGGGVNALKAFGADKMGMTDEEMQETVDLWRESSPRIVSWWWSLDKAAKRAILKRGTVVDAQGGIRFDYENGILWTTLPSGRRIAYWGARVEESKLHHGKKTISFWGIDQKTKKWTRIETYGPRLAENITQATARDCLRDAMFALNEAGFDVIAHVHDEVIITEPLDGRGWEDVAEIMSRPLPWAEGLPLNAAGYDGAYYFKD